MGNFQSHGQGQLPKVCADTGALLEALLVMALLLGVLWFAIYPLGFLTQNRLARVAAELPVAALLVFALFLSPAFRRESRASRGLGSPARFLELLTYGTWRGRLRVAMGATLLTSLLTYELYHFTTGGSRFVIGIGPDVTLATPGTMGGKCLLSLGCLVSSLVWSLWFVRWDNFWPTLKMGGRLLAVALPIVISVGLLLNGSHPIHKADARRLMDVCFGYCFWAALQQWLFCGYFVSRFRTAFGIDGEGTALLLKRLFVSCLAGCFFGLIHLDNWPFVLLACMLGTILSLLFLDSRYQNLQASGVIHGILGTCIIWLFCTPGVRFHIPLRAGPWQTGRGPDWVALSVTAGIILLLLGWSLVACWPGVISRLRRLGTLGYSRGTERADCSSAS